MPTYVYDKAKGCMVDKATGEPMNDPDQEWTPTTPQIVADVPDYNCPITGDRISGRRAHRYNLEKHDCVEATQIKGSPPKRKLKNKRFIEKYGLQDRAAEGVLHE